MAAIQFGLEVQAFSYLITSISDYFRAGTKETIYQCIQLAGRLAY
jgi:hypothetical protein